jgi:hypothetical protein
MERYGDSTNLTGEITKDKILIQPFIALDNFLKAISIEFATFCRVNHSTITLEILDEGKIIRSLILNSQKISDNSSHVFNVEQDLVKDKRYELKMYSSDGVYGNAITAKYGNSKHENTYLKINKDIIRGELSCLFYFGKDLEEKPKIKNPLDDFQRHDRKHPELSIVIPTAKRLDHLKQCLDSLRANTTNYETIIISNSPKTDFAISVTKLAALYPNTFVLTIPYYAGYVVPCNMGAAMSRGDYICILNDDTIAYKNWCSNMLKVLKKDTEIGQVGPSLAYIDNSFGFSLTKTERHYIEGWCFIIPREVYKEVGLFDKDLEFAYCEDSDLSTNLIHHKYKVKQVSANIKHIGTQTSKSDSTMKKYTDECETKNKAYLHKKWKMKKGEK